VINVYALFIGMGAAHLQIQTNRQSNFAYPNLANIRNANLTHLALSLFFEGISVDYLILRWISPNYSHI